MSDDLIKLTIDGKAVEAPKGTSILEAARTIGIEIPHFCYHPDLSWCGQCRMCFVEVEKMPKLATACCTTIGPDMVVHTDTPKVKEARRAVLEFQLLHHPVDCPICDQAGECSLQDFYMKYGLYDANVNLEDKDHHSKAIDLGEFIVLDRERCVLCFRCVRFCAEVTGSHALKPQWRGGHSEITTFNEGPIEDEYSGTLADLCPVGALTSKKFRFKCRSWFLDRADSICAGCSTGCNIRIDSYKNEIKRYVARRNPEVNKSWLCNEGRMSWENLQKVNRLESPMLRKDGELVTVSWEEAMGELLKRLKKAGAGVAAIGSNRAANEELFLLRNIVTECGGEQFGFRVDDSADNTAEKADKLLKRKDKNPNSKGAQALDFGGIDKISGAALLLLYKQDLLKRNAEKGPKIMESAGFTVVFSPYKTETAKAADLVLPVAEYFETSGTFTNYAGMIQQFNKAVEAPGQTREGWQVLNEVLIALNAKKVYTSTAAVTAVVKEELVAKADAKAKAEAAKQAVADAEEKAKADIEAAKDAAAAAQKTAVDNAVNQAKQMWDMEMQEKEEEWEEKLDDAVDEAVKKALAEKGIEE